MIPFTAKSYLRSALLVIAATLVVSLSQWIPHGASSFTDRGGSDSAQMPIKKTAPDVRPKARKVSLKGVIVGHTTDELLLRTVEGLDRVIKVTKETQLVERKSNPFRSARQFSQYDLLPGLNVEVEADEDNAGQLVAKQIKFSQADLKLARTISLLLQHLRTDKENFDLRLNMVEQNADHLSGQLDTLAAVSNTARQGAKTAQDTADSAVAGVNTLRNETQILRDVTRTEQVRLAQQVGVIRSELERVSADVKRQKNGTRAPSTNGATPQATPSDTPNPVSPNDFARQLDAVDGILNGLVPGKLLHDIPPAMQISVPRTVNVSIVKEVTREIHSRFGEDATIKDIRIGSVMAVSLVSGDGAFEIKRQFPVTSDTQVVGNDEAKWVFAITPSQPGDHVLEVFATVHIDVPGQGLQSKNIPVFYGPVKVNVGFFYYPWSFIKTNWDKIAGLLVSSGIVGLLIGWILNKRKKQTNIDDVHEVD